MGEKHSRTPFGLRMLEARRHAKMTQEQVCARMSMSQSGLAEAERKHHGSGRTVEFAALYGVSVRWLATGEGEMLAAEAMPTLAAKDDAAQAQNHALQLANLFDQVPEGRAKVKLYNALTTMIQDHLTRAKRAAARRGRATTAEPQADQKKPREIVPATRA